jgi:urea transport system substrate-binding protein
VSKYHVKPSAAPILVSLLALFALGLFSACGNSGSGDTSSSASASASTETIKVGIVAPISGPGAILGRGNVVAAKLWAQQVNDNGGLLGRNVELLIQDSATDPKTSAEKGKQVLAEGAQVVTGHIYGTEFGALSPVVYEAGKIMLQPVYYHGGWYNDLLFTTGEVPEQAVDKFVPWLIEKYGKKFYFIGSDYNYPHVTNGLAKDILVAQGGQSVGEEYAALGTTEFSAMLARIQKAKPDLVFGNLVGTDAVAFMKQFYDAGLSKQMGLYEPIDQSFVPAIGVKQSEGVAVCQGYFDSLDTPTNNAFVAAWKKLDPEVPPVDITASLYVALQLWAKGVELAGTTDSQAVAAKMEGLTLTDTPVGEITMRATDHHSTRHMYIAVCTDGVMKVVEDLGMIEPGVDQRKVNRE